MVKEDLWERSVGEGLRYVRTYVRKSCGRQAALEAQLKASHVFFVLVRTSCLHERAYVRSAMCARQFGSSSGAIAFVQATCARTYVLSIQAGVPGVHSSPCPPRGGSQ